VIRNLSKSKGKLKYYGCSIINYWIHQPSDLFMVIEDDLQRLKVFIKKSGDFELAARRLDVRPSSGSRLDMEDLRLRKDLVAEVLAQ